MQGHAHFQLGIKQQMKGKENQVMIKCPDMQVRILVSFNEPEGFPDKSPVRLPALCNPVYFQPGIEIIKDMLKLAFGIIADKNSSLFKKILTQYE